MSVAESSGSGITGGQGRDRMQLLRKAALDAAEHIRLGRNAAEGQVCAKDSNAKGTERMRPGGAHGGPGYMGRSFSFFPLP